MLGLPKPEPGLVISYSYLWSSEAARGRVEGRKDRPCAIVVARIDPRVSSGSCQVVVVPITHRAPSDLSAAIEIPVRVKEHLALDGARSWVVVNEFNVFNWPGFDLRPIQRGTSRVHDGLLPPKLFDRIIARFTELRADAKCQGAAR
jgi:hypothetical protein